MKVDVVDAVAYLLRVPRKGMLLNQQTVMADHLGNQGADLLQALSGGNLRCKPSADGVNVQRMDRGLFNGLAKIRVDGHQHVPGILQGI